MSPGEWRHIRSTPRETLQAALTEMHHAVQLVAAAGEAFAERHSDGSHRTTRWSADRRRLVGADFTGGYPFRMALEPDAMCLVLLERSGDVLGGIELPGRTLAEAYDWMGRAATTYLGRPYDPVSPPAFPIAGHGQSRRFASPSEGVRRAATALFAMADPIVGSVSEGQQGAGPVRCWPHEFDLSATVHFAGVTGGVSGQSVRFGLAPHGGGYDSWYWFVSLWPTLGDGEATALDGPGRLHRGEWSGAVLAGETILGAGDGGAARVRTFLQDRVRSFLEVVANRRVGS